MEAGEMKKQKAMRPIAVVFLFFLHQKPSPVRLVPFGAEALRCIHHILQYALYTPEPICIQNEQNPTRH
jgi:hypothetical protein